MWTSQEAIPSKTNTFEAKVRGSPVFGHGYLRHASEMRGRNRDDTRSRSEGGYVLSSIHSAVFAVSLLCAGDGQHK